MAISGVKTSRGIYDYQGRNEVEILRKRDELYLKMLRYLEEIHALTRSDGTGFDNVSFW